MREEVIRLNFAQNMVLLDSKVFPYGTRAVVFPEDKVKVDIVTFLDSSHEWSVLMETLQQREFRQGARYRVVIVEDEA